MCTSYNTMPSYNLINWRPAYIFKISNQLNKVCARLVDYSIFYLSSWSFFFRNSILSGVSKPVGNPLDIPLGVMSLNNKLKWFAQMRWKTASIYNTLQQESSDQFRQRLESLRLPPHLMILRSPIHPKVSYQLLHHIEPPIKYFHQKCPNFT